MPRDQGRRLHRPHSYLMHAVQKGGFNEINGRIEISFF